MRLADRRNPCGEFCEALAANSAASLGGVKSGISSLKLHGRIGSAPTDEGGELSSFAFGSGRIHRGPFLAARCGGLRGPLGQEACPDESCRKLCLKGLWRSAWTVQNSSAGLFIQSQGFLCSRSCRARTDMCRRSESCVRSPWHSCSRRPNSLSGMSDALRSSGSRRMSS